MIWVLAFIVFYLACSYAAYWITFNHFQTQFPTIAEQHIEHDKEFASFVALFGPIGFIASVFCSTFKLYG